MLTWTLDTKSAGGSTTSQPCMDTTPAVGLWPKRPQKADGVLTDPPVSDPKKSQSLRHNHIISFSIFYNVINRIQYHSYQKITQTKRNSSCSLQCSFTPWRSTRSSKYVVRVFTDTINRIWRFPPAADRWDICYTQGYCSSLFKNRIEAIFFYK